MTYSIICVSFPLKYLMFARCQIVHALHRRTYALFKMTYNVIIFVSSCGLYYEMLAWFLP